MTYHVHTEYFRNLGDLTSKYFDGFSIIPATGYWKGLQESAAVIEIATDDPSKVRALAAEIKRTNRQEAVLVESMITSTEMV